jgi:hypothetical protein
MILKIGQYFLNVLIAIDYLANAVAGGDPDESISERLGREWPNSFMRKFVDFLFGKNHCKEAGCKDTGKAVLK